MITISRVREEKHHDCHCYVRDVTEELEEFEKAQASPSSAKKNGNGNNGSNGNGRGTGGGDTTNTGGSTNQSGILFPIKGEVSELEQEMIDMIKTDGKHKDYKLIEYVNDVNREHTEVLMELNINGIMDTAYSYGMMCMGILPLESRSTTTFTIIMQRVIIRILILYA